MAHSGRKKLGEFLALTGFISVVSTLVIIYTRILFSKLLVYIAAGGFLMFIIGTELYLRNRKDWNDL